MPIFAPRCFGSAAMIRSVSDDALNNRVLRRSTLALRAVAIATRVIGDVLMVTFCASRNVTAEGCRAAILNRRHHLQLWQVQVPCLFTTIGTAMGTENVRDL